MNPARDWLIIHIPVPTGDPATLVPPAALVQLAEQINHLLRGVRTAVCSGWASTTGDGEQQPHLTAWLDVDCALVVTDLRPDHTLLELHISARPAAAQPADPGQLCCRTAE